jgi:hypothetical protein
MLRANETNVTLTLGFARLTRNRDSEKCSRFATSNRELSIDPSDARPRLVGGNGRASRGFPYDGANALLSKALGGARVSRQRETSDIMVLREAVFPSTFIED